jgi:hypothetical protein
MDEMMDFPKTWREFVEYYGFLDKKQVYTNGSVLIPVFRVEQWLEHIKNRRADDVES